MALEILTQEQIRQDPEQQIRSLRRRKRFLVAIDTDGCVTDNMNGKQMLVFHPQYMEFYQLWGIESYFREVAEYYNLFSVHRGCNRFLAVQMTLEALHSRRDVAEAAAKAHAALPDRKVVDDYVAWCTQAKMGLGNPSLEKFLETRPLDLSVYKLLAWSEAVNRTFPFVNTKIPLFAGVKEALDLMAQHADILVVSQTPYDDLVNYWTAQGIDRYVCAIAGQEMGTKAHHIETAKKAAGYADDEVLMIGDGDGDLKAVKKNNGLFYPIPTGREEEAWRALPDCFRLFTEGKYRGEVEDRLIRDFSEALLKTPPWEEAGYDHVASYRQKQEVRRALYRQLNPGGRLLIL